MSLREWKIPVPFGTTVGPHATGGMVIRFQPGREREVMRALEIALQRLKSAEPHSFAGEAIETPPEVATAPQVSAGGMAPPLQPPGSQFSPFSMPIPAGTPGGVMAPPPVPVSASGQFDPTLAKIGGGPGMMGPGSGVPGGGPMLPQPAIAPPPAPTVDPAAQASVYNQLPDTPGGARPVPVAVEWERDENGRLKLDAQGKRIPVVGDVLAPMPQPAIARPPAPPIMNPGGGVNNASAPLVSPPADELLGSDEDIDAQLARLALVKRRREEMRKAEEDALLEQAEKIRAARAGSTLPAPDDTGKQLALPASVPPPPPPAE